MLISLLKTVYNDMCILSKLNYSMRCQTLFYSNLNVYIYVPVY